MRSTNIGKVRSRGKLYLTEQRLSVIYEHCSNIQKSDEIFDDNLYICSYESVKLDTMFFQVWLRHLSPVAILAG